MRAVPYSGANLAMADVASPAFRYEVDDAVSGGAEDAILRDGHDVPPSLTSTGCACAKAGESGLYRRDARLTSEIAKTREGAGTKWRRKRKRPCGAAMPATIRREWQGLFSVRLREGNRRLMRPVKGSREDAAPPEEDP